MDAQKFNRLLDKIKYDKSAVSAIYHEYFARLKAHLHRRFGKLIDAEDAAQEVFLKLMTVENVGYVEYPATWIFKFADNFVIDLLRKDRMKIVELNEAVNLKFDIDNTVLNEDVKRAMKNLDENSQLILHMFYWEGYSLIEIAMETNDGYANVRAKVSRAYKELKKYL